MNIKVVLQNTDRKDGSNCDMEQAREERKNQNIMPTNSCEQVMDTMQHSQQCQPCPPNNCAIFWFLVPVNRLIRHVSRSIQKLSFPSFGLAILALLATWACLGKMDNNWTTFVQLLPKFCSTFEARTPLHRPV